MPIMDKSPNNQSAKPALALFTVLTGDEILLISEASDQIKNSATALGCTERNHLVMDARSDWAELLGQAQNVSLFGDLRFLEISLPTGKPGKSGAAALEKLAEMSGTGALNDLLSIIFEKRSVKASPKKRATGTSLGGRRGCIRLRVFARLLS